MVNGQLTKHKIPLYLRKPIYYAYDQRSGYKGKPISFTEYLRLSNRISFEHKFLEAHHMLLIKNLFGDLIRA